jgi:N-methylhydantoinase A/oxoprolinase/acetone carboxylase beta subunit
MRHIGVDVGGTFTDLVLTGAAGQPGEPGGYVVHKVPSTPDDPSRAIVEGIAELCALGGIEPADVGLVVHGTTVATNMLIERTGAPAGMITTEGFRDLLHIARKKRPFNFSSHQDVPWQKYPLIRRRHRLTVPERVAGPDGQVVTPLDEDAVRAAAEQLKDSGLRSIAVCFLFSFLNPEHERRAVQIVRTVLPDAFVSASHEIVPLYREYERFNTTAVNVYIGPATSGYLGSLVTALGRAGVGAPVRLMSSASGMVTAEAAMRMPVTLLMSGPAAGLLAGVQTGRAAGNPSVITLDVGGTSSDIGIAPGGEVRMRHLLDTKVQDCQVMIPMADIETVGAGGGSIASVSAEGVLDVGPGSAGAVPGPVCYGRGGTQPTVTDAVAVLGWLRSETFFGGRLTLGVDAAREAVTRAVAEPLGVSAEQAAAGIYTVATHNIANAIAQLSIRRGHDPRDFALVAQGGAGPLFACSMAAETGVARVIVPPHPGLASAFGLLSTDIRYEFVATAWRSSGGLDPAELDAKYQDLLRTARDQLAADGVPEADMSFEFHADCRYPSQGYELRVPGDAPPVDDGWLAKLISRFHELHQATYRSSFEDRDVHIVNVRVVAVGRVARPAAAGLEVPTDHVPDPDARIGGWFGAGGRLAQQTTMVYARDRLKAGARILGPAVIEQPDTTTVVEPGFQAVVDPRRNLVITAQGDRP